jgi:hypothetical protein
MKTLVNILRELAGLFIDDGLLALAISAVVVFAAIVVAIAPAMPIGAGIVLLVGCLGALCSNVMRAGSRLSAEHTCDQPRAADTSISGG